MTVVQSARLHHIKIPVFQSCDPEMKLNMIMQFALSDTFFYEIQMRILYGNEQELTATPTPGYSFEIYDRVIQNYSHQLSL